MAAATGVPPADASFPLYASNASPTHGLSSLLIRPASRIKLAASVPLLPLSSYTRRALQSGVPLTQQTSGLTLPYRYGEWARELVSRAASEGSDVVACSHCRELQLRLEASVALCDSLQGELDRAKERAAASSSDVGDGETRRGLSEGSAVIAAAVSHVNDALDQVRFLESIAHDLQEGLVPAAPSTSTGGADIEHLLGGSTTRAQPSASRDVVGDSSVEAAADGSAIGANSRDGGLKSTSTQTFPGLDVELLYSSMPKQLFAPSGPTAAAATVKAAPAAASATSDTPEALTSARVAMDAVPAFSETSSPSTINTLIDHDLCAVRASSETSSGTSISPVASSLSLLCTYAVSESHIAPTVAPASATAALASSFLSSAAATSATVASSVAAAPSTAESPAPALPVRLKSTSPKLTTASASRRKAPAAPVFTAATAGVRRAGPPRRPAPKRPIIPPAASSTSSSVRVVSPFDATALRDSDRSPTSSIRIISTTRVQIASPAAQLLQRDRDPNTLMCTTQQPVLDGSHLSLFSIAQQHVHPVDSPALSPAQGNASYPLTPPQHDGGDGGAGARVEPLRIPLRREPRNRISAPVLLHHPAVTGPLSFAAVAAATAAPSPFTERSGSGDDAIPALSMVADARRSLHTDADARRSATVTEARRVSVVFSDGQRSAQDSVCYSTSTREQEEALGVMTARDGLDDDDELGSQVAASSVCGGDDGAKPRGDSATNSNSNSTNSIRSSTNSRARSRSETPPDVRARPSPPGQSVAAPLQYTSTADADAVPPQYSSSSTAPAASPLYAESTRKRPSQPAAAASEKHIPGSEPRAPPPIHENLRAPARASPAGTLLLLQRFSLPPLPASYSARSELIPTARSDDVAFSPHDRDRSVSNAITAPAASNHSRCVRRSVSNATAAPADGDLFEAGTGAALHVRDLTRDFFSTVEQSLLEGAAAAAAAPPDGRSSGARDILHSSGGPRSVSSTSNITIGTYTGASETSRGGVLDRSASTTHGVRSEATRGAAFASSVHTEERVSPRNPLRVLDEWKRSLRSSGPAGAASGASSVDRGNRRLGSPLMPVRTLRF